VSKEACVRLDRRDAVCAPLLCLSALALQPAGADPAALEPVLVTGTRLSVSEAASGRAVLVVAQDRLSRAATASIEEALSRLPQFVPVAGPASNSPGNDGQANLSLRGIGASQTLVLLDGRRQTPADGRGVVDVNLIPPALIESVEVVTGGASAVYGSDAIAGVVNLRLKPSFEGAEARAAWSRSSRGDGDQYSADLTLGSSLAAGRGSLVASLGYAKRDLLYQDARARSRQPLRYYSDEASGVGPGQAFLDYGSGITAEGVNVVFADPVVFDEVFARYGFEPGSVPYQAGIGVNADGTLYTIGDQATSGTVVNYQQPSPRPGYNDRIVTTNLAGETALQLPLERRSAFVAATLDLTDTTRLLVQGLFADYSTSQVLGPPDSGILLVEPTNPYIPSDLGRLLASRVNAQAPFRLLKRLEGLPDLVATHDRDMVQLTGAVDGVLAGSWTWQGYLQWGRNRRVEYSTGNALTGEIEMLLNQPDGGQSLCGAFNLFGAHGIAPDCVARITADARNHMEVRQFIVEAVARGTLAAVPAGDLLAAIGAFYKDDEFRFRADPLAAGLLPAVPGLIGPRPVLAGFPIAPSRQGSESNADLFAELQVPLWLSADRQRLAASLGYRRAGYRRAGGFDAFKAELALRPSPAWTLRGSYQRALRAPSIEELFFPQLRGQLVVTPPDPCSVSSPQRSGPDAAAVRALCLAQGMPESLVDRYEYPLARVEGVTGGNPDLAAERSTSVTAGIEYSVAGLTLTLDGYRIELDDAIGRWETDSAIRRCFDTAYNPGFEPDNAYCSYFQRSAIDGTIFAYEIDRNAGGIETRGVDLRLTWQGDAGPGRAGIDAYLGYVDDWSLREPDGGTVQLAGTLGSRAFGGSLPRWKGLLAGKYSWRAWRVSASYNYVDSMGDARYREFNVPSVSYLGVSAALGIRSGWLGGATLELGVENLTDTAPPLFPSYQQANTDPSQYDVLGRRYWMSLRYPF
jgi:outer membrane receptor protein involved in Fe transport